MNLTELNKLIEDKDLLTERIYKFIEQKLIKRENKDENEIKGHIEKSEHNLKFVFDNLKLDYLDWCVTGCYYAIYHSALALILNKGFNSKNHDATICLLIKEYYPKEIDKELISMLNWLFLNYQDLLFYLHTKERRKDATYSSKYKFDKNEVEEVRLKTIAFVNKAKAILGVS